jgi:hypothetical protein
MIQSIEEGRKEDGNRSIADKIIKRLHDLDKTVENNQGRWAWELLQNAKDSIADDNDRKVAVQIELNSDTVEFRHNGIHFNEQDVRGLINQISSKETEEGQHSTKTGRFGTGFLTTHLLSRVIKIKGILQTTDNEFYNFEFPLDREGKTTIQLIPKIENAWTAFHDSTIKVNPNYNQDNFNTSFCYHLNSLEQREIARIGVEEFIKLIPYVLAFIPKIDRVEIIDITNDKRITFLNEKEKVDDLIVTISKTENTVETDILILRESNVKVAIATEIEKTKQGYSIKNIQDVPKLFCDFPLIGTHNFHFPVVINSFFFNPQTERDGVWLKGKDDPEVEENQGIIESARELYELLLSRITEMPFSNLYNFVETKMPDTNEKYFDEKWYQEFIQKPIREFILNAEIVELENDATKKHKLTDLWFPIKSYTQAIQDKIWQFNFDLFPSAVCKKHHLHNWCEVSWEGWNKTNYNEVVKDLVEIGSIEKLKDSLCKSESETYDWLNSVCNFLLEEDSNLSFFEINALTPNQNGSFEKRAALFIDKINDSDLIDILELLGDDWRNLLVHESINFGKYHVKEKKDIAAKITEKLKNPSNKDEDAVKAISLLSEWFESNKELAKEFFTELYRRRAELFMNTIMDRDSLYKVMRSKTDLAELSKIAEALAANPELIENIRKAEELTSLLQEFNAQDVTELKRMLLVAQGVNANNMNAEITQDVLISLGVSTIEELEAALNDKDLALMFNHTSTPNVDMFVYAQKLISRTKKNIIEHLNERHEYDCTELEELANTVIGGVKKNGLSIHIVIRPSDNGEVIVYYSSEKDTLDVPNAELWIDDGKKEPRLLTLGKILKTTGINKIPV